MSFMQSSRLFSLFLIPFVSGSRSDKRACSREAVGHVLSADLGASCSPQDGSSAAPLHLVAGDAQHFLGRVLVSALIVRREQHSCRR